MTKPYWTCPLYEKYDAYSGGHDWVNCPECVTGFNEKIFNMLTQEKSNMQVCKQCKLEVSEDYLNENGVCVLCEGMKVCDFCYRHIGSDIQNGVSDELLEITEDADGTMICEHCKKEE